MATRQTSHQPTEFALETILTELLKPSIEQLSARISHLPADCSVEQVHQSRVLIRTLRAQLDTFDPLLKKRATKSVTKSLKWLDALLAPLRNTDVTAELLTSSLVTVLDTGNEAASLRLHIVHQLDEQRHQQAQALFEQLNEQRVSELRAGLDEFLRVLPMRQPVSSLSSGKQLQTVNECLRREQKKLLKLAIQTKKQPSIRNLHQVRIQAKLVHYSYEAAQSQDVISDVRTITLAEKLHKLLGKHQDAAMARDWLKNLQLNDANFLPVRAIWLRDLKRIRKKMSRKYLYLLERKLA